MQVSNADEKMQQRIVGFLPQWCSILTWIHAVPVLHTRYIHSPEYTQYLYYIPGCTCRCSSRDHKRWGRMAWQTVSPQRSWSKHFLFYWDLSGIDDGSRINDTLFKAVPSVNNSLKDKVTSHIQAISADGIMVMPSTHDKGLWVQLWVVLLSHYVQLSTSYHQTE